MVPGDEADVGPDRASGLAEADGAHEVTERRRGVVDRRQGQLEHVAEHNERRRLITVADERPQALTQRAEVEVRDDEMTNSAHR